MIAGGAEQQTVPPRHSACPGSASPRGPPLRPSRRRSAPKGCSKPARPLRGRPAALSPTEGPEAAALGPPRRAQAGGTPHPRRGAAGPGLRAPRTRSSPTRTRPHGPAGLRPRAAREAPGAPARRGKAPGPRRRGRAPSEASAPRNSAGRRPRRRCTRRTSARASPRHRPRAAYAQAGKPPLATITYAPRWRTYQRLRALLSLRPACQSYLPGTAPRLSYWAVCATRSLIGSLLAVSHPVGTLLWA